MDEDHQVMTVKLVEYEDRTHRANVIVTRGTTWDMFMTKVKERLGYLRIEGIENEDGDPVESLVDLEHKSTCYVKGQSYAKLRRLQRAYQSRTVTEAGNVETTSEELATLMENVEVVVVGEKEATASTSNAVEDDAEGSMQQLRAGQFRASFYRATLGIGLEPGEKNVGAVVSDAPERGADGSGSYSEDADEDEVENIFFFFP